MKTVSDKVPKKVMRKFLQDLQPSSGCKENLVGVGRTSQDTLVDPKMVKPEQIFNEMETKTKVKKENSSISNVNSSLYKKLLIEDLTSTAGPSEKYWEVIAERRRKALEEVLEENQRLQALVDALENENMSCKQLLENTTDLINTLKEAINEDQCNNDDDKETHDYPDDSGLSTPDSYSSGQHVHKKMKFSNDDECLDSD